MRHGVAAALALSLAFAGASPAAAAPPASFDHVDWSRDATLYEVNIRQYTGEGTLNAFRKELPRLQKMGVKVLWIMPVQPIGVKERKGPLGSYYSIRDYTDINPDFGTRADFKALVDEAHARGLKVILDWVANHTAWDHPWVTAHPDYYKKDSAGKIFPVTFNEGTPSVEYWTDVVGLDYANPATREAMIEAMGWWVREMGIDGFRCDVAGLVPIDFWVDARRRLDARKPLFWLAEWHDPKMHAAFDMSYDWTLMDTLVAIAKGEKTADDLRDWVRRQNEGFPPDAYRMNFTSNHDVNSWRWGDKETYGASFEAMATIAALLPGMPMVYSGQEAGLTKKLEFFQRDPIDWSALGGKANHVALYTRLLRLKRAHPALRMGREGAPPMLIDAGNPHVFAFQRDLEGHAVTVAVNLSPQPVTIPALPDIPAQELQPWRFAIGQH